MAEFTSIFSDPVNGAFAYPLGGSTLEHEADLAQKFGAGMGEYLYSRPIRQVLMRTGERYAFSFYDPASYVMYRKHDEAWNGKFDYYKSKDDNRTVVFTVLHSVYVPECKMNVDVQIKLRFDTPRSIEFRALCKENLVSIEFRDGIAVMRFYKSAHLPCVTTEALLHILPPEA